MEPRGQSGGIEAALQALEDEVTAYLNSRLNASGSAIDKVLWAEAPVECPEVYGKYLSLRLYAGPSGVLPFVAAGGYNDQPYLTSLCLERCIVARRNFDSLQTLNAMAAMSSGDPLSTPPSPVLVGTQSAGGQREL